MPPQTQSQIDLSDGLVAKPGIDLSDGLVAKDDATPPAPNPTFGSSPSDVLDTVGSHLAAIPTGLYNTVAHPYDTFVKPTVEAGSRAVSQFKQGKYSDAARSAESAIPIVGPWADNIENEVGQKGAVAGLSGLATDILGAKALGAATKGAAGAVSKFTGGRTVVPGENYTPVNRDAYAGVLAKGSGGEGFFAKQVANDITSHVRQAAADNPELAKTAISGSPDDSLAAHQALLQKAQTRIDAAHNAAKNPVADTPVDVKPIQDALPKLRDFHDDAERAQVQDLHDRIGKVKTLDDLNEFRQYMGDENQARFSRNVVDASPRSVQDRAYAKADTATRNHYYDQLENATGQDFQALKRTEGSIIQAQRALGKSAARLSNTESKFNAPNSIRGTAADFIDNGTGSAHGIPLLGYAATKLRGTPLFQMQEGLRQTLSKLPPPSPRTVVGPAPVPAVSPQLNSGQLRLNHPANPELDSPTTAAPAYQPPSGLPQEGGVPKVATGPQAPQLEAGEGNPEYVTPLPSPPPPFNPAVARTRATAGSSPATPGSLPPGEYTVTPDGQIIPKRPQLKAPESKPKGKKLQETDTLDGQTAAGAQIPAEVEALLHRTGARITNKEAPTSRSVASVDPDQPNTINVDDLERFSRDKNARNQTLSHEAVHIWHQNLPPEVQRMIPMDDPKDLYGKDHIGYDQDELKGMRSQGLTLENLPREKAAAVIQTYAHLGGDNAPKEIRDVYKPWADDLVHSQLSAIQPSSADTPGLVTTPRAPGAADLHETRILGEQKEKTSSKNVPIGNKPGAGEVVGYDSEDGLPIIRRTSVAARANEPSPKPAKEDSPDGKRDILHASKDRAELVQEARDEAPSLKEGLEAVADKVPGAEVNAVRAEKSPKRLDEKIKREGQPVETIPDILAGRLAVDSNEAHRDVADTIKQHATVVRDQDNFKKGDSRFGYRAHKLQVQVSPKMSAEVHIVPRETAAQDDKQHPVYVQARKAELDGDTDKADVLAEKAKGMNDEAKSRFDRRNKENDQQPVKKSEAVNKSAPMSEGHKVGDRVTLPNGKLATVAYAPAKDSQLPTYRFRGDDGTTTTMRASEAHTRVKKAPDDVKGTVLVDLDRTLSFARGQESRTHIGAPEPAMVARIKDDLAAGKKVKIFTARVANDKDGKVREAIQAWSRKHLGVALDVTDKKLPGTGEILDDKSEHVRPNTGRVSA